LTESPAHRRDDAKWAARDNDRTMLYAAEIPIRLPK
jgi:hypothetical protein